MIERSVQKLGNSNAVTFPDGFPVDEDDNVQVENWDEDDEHAEITFSIRL